MAKAIKLSGREMGVMRSIGFGLGALASRNANSRCT